MNVLFYVEPLIEMGRPFWKDYWSNVYSQKLIQALFEDPSSESHQCMLLLSEALALKFPNQHGVPVKVLSQEELLAPFAGNYLDASLAWYRSTYTPQQLEYYCKLLKEKTNGFIPDAVITFSPAPFFRSLFPDAVLLNHEFTLFSRAPFPACWHLDPAGSVGNSYLSAHASAIGNAPVAPHDLIPLQEFKNTVQALINSKSPFKRWLEEEHQRYDKLLMLPLQFSGYYAFDGLTKYKTQYDYMTDVFNQVGDGIGIVVTQHPEYPVLSPGVIEFMRYKYPNFLYTPALEDYYAASQYVIAGVDGLVSVSTSTAYQALIWDKKLIALGENFCQWFADGCELSEAGEVLSRPARRRDNILYWLMTRYAILEKYLYSSEWLRNFLHASVSKHRQGPLDTDFYGLIADPRELFSSFISGLYSDIPIPSASQRERARQGRTGFQGALPADSAPAYDVSIILTVGERLEQTLACLQSLAKAQIESLRMEIIIVSSGSYEVAQALFKSLDGDVKIVHSTGSQGLAKACNQGAALADGKFLWFVHNDIQVEPECLRALLGALDGDPNAAAAGASLQGAREKNPFPGKPEPTAADEAGMPVKADYCPTACCLVRKDVFTQLKGFDPSFSQALYVDKDFGKRLSILGYHTVICPDARAGNGETLSTSLQSGRRYSNSPL